MLNCELRGYIQFIIDIAFIETLKLSFSHHFYSHNVHLKDIRVTVLQNMESSEKKHNEIMFRTQKIITLANNS